MLTKFLFAMLPMALVAALTSTGGAGSIPAPRPEAVSPAETGGCRYFCGNDPTAHRTRSACQAVCATVCEPVC